MPSVRPAHPDDAKAVAAIFEQGIEDRVATFETRVPGVEEWRRRLESDEALMLIAEHDDRVIAFAIADPYADRHRYYDGIREATMYVERESRRRVESGGTCWSSNGCWARRPMAVAPATVR